MKKIKIIFIHDRLVCGGTDQALFDLVRLLDKEKFDVTVFAQKHGGPWDQKFADAGIRVLYDFSCRKATWNPIAKLGNIVKKLRIQLAYKRNGEGLMEVCYPEDPDIVVTYAAWDHILCGFDKRAKSIKYIHGNMETNHAFRDLILRDKELLPKYARIICVSQLATEAFMAHTGIRENVEFCFNPMDSEHVRKLAQEPVELPEDLPLICAVGRLSAEKAFERLLVMHKQLLDQGIRHRLVIVGDGPDRDFLPRLVRALEVEDTVILAGYQSNPYPYMKRSKFLVCSSFTEGLPVIAMEALCLGVPMVSAVPSVAEAFGEEECGLITENDNRSLLEGIRKVLTDEDYYQKLKQGAENRSNYFNGHRMAKEAEKIFLSVMEE